MYRISDEQIDYILNDIRRGGIETEDLQLNLLDHICCIIERELEAGGDFEQFYRATARRFYKNNLREIEDETTNLLTFKNYYAMKKVLIGGGTFAAFSLITGSFFKVQHWPGASVLLTLGIGTFTLMFLPLLAILKARETTAARDKIVLFLACLLGATFSLAILFIVQHWPGSNILMFGSMAISAFVLLPIYFFTGIRKPESKLNTILVSILLVGFTGTQFALMNTRPGRTQEQERIQAYVNNEVLLKTMVPATVSPQAVQINTLCERVKTMLLDNAGTDPVHTLREGRVSDAFVNGGAGIQLLTVLRDAIASYNRAHSAEMVPLENTVLRLDPTQVGLQYSNVTMLNSITQVQMYLASAESNRMVTAQH